MDGALQHLEPGPPLNALLDRTAELKADLVRFAIDHHFLDIFADKLVDGVLVLRDEDEVDGIIDAFVTDHEFPDGSTLHDHFVLSRPDLSARDRAVVLGWKDSLTGVFRIDTANGVVFDAVNEVDDMPYRVLTNAGPRIAAQARPGS